MPKPTKEQLEKLVQEIRAVCLTNNRPDLILPIAKSKARNSFLRSEILAATSLDELDEIIEVLASSQENRLHDLAALRAKIAGEEVGQILSTAAEEETAFKESDNKIAANTLESDQDALSKLSRELSSLYADVGSTVTSVKILLAELPLRELDGFHIGDLKMTPMEAQRSFRSWRKWRKRHLQIYRFAVAPVVFGVVVSLAISNLPKIFTEGASLFAISVIIAFFYAVVKHYKIDPAVRNIILNRQRKYLLANLDEFAKLDLALTVYMKPEEIELAKDIP